MESTPRPTDEVASLPKASRCDHVLLFRQQRKVAVGPGLMGKGLFATEPTERDQLVVELKGERIS